MDLKNLDRRIRLTATLIVLANLIPVIGILFFDWDVFRILALFWLENVFIGLFAIVKLTVSRSYHEYREGLFVPLFFLVHYGGFMAGHAMVILVMYTNQFEEAARTAPLDQFLAQFLKDFSWLAAAALFFSHAWSFVANFLGNDEKKQLTVRGAMTLPYRRMVITHVALLVGGFFLVEKGQPLVGVILLVILKIALDVMFHINEHRRLSPVGLETR